LRRLHRGDLLGSLFRLEQIDDLREVKEATLEPDGRLSVIKTEAARQVSRADVARVLGRAA
jgi:uncharacterized membrane protein YcaP (DUF421 family)